MASSDEIVVDLENFDPWAGPYDFLSLEKHLWLSFICCAAFLPPAVWAWNDLRERNAGRLPSARANGRAYRKGLADWLLAAVLVLTLSLCVIFRFGHGWQIWLLQPCYVMNALLIFVAVSSNDTLANLALNITHGGWLYGALLALLSPDISEIAFPFETINFFVQHYALVLAPIFFYMSGRFDTPPVSQRFQWILVAWSTFVVYQNLFLRYSGMLLETNLNYMLFPFKEMEHLGELYQVYGFLGFFVLSFCVGNTYWLVGDLVNLAVGRKATGRSKGNGARSSMSTSRKKRTKRA